MLSKGAKEKSRAHKVDVEQVSVEIARLEDESKMKRGDSYTLYEQELADRLRLQLGVPQPSLLEHEGAVNQASPVSLATTFGVSVDFLSYRCCRVRQTE